MALPTFLLLVPRLVWQIAGVTAIAASAYFWAYNRGVSHERAQWQAKVQTAQSDADKKAVKSEHITEKTKVNYENKIKDINARLSVMVDVNSALAKRLRDTSSASAVQIPAAPSCPSGEPAPVDTNREAIDRENQRRFEVNKAKLEEIQQWLQEQIKLHN